MREIPNELAPCGVFCGACPSFLKTCLECASENKEQSRKSKWGCKIRDCCYNNKNNSFCIECDKYPCKIYNKKLLDTHQGDTRFKYRHEIPEIFMQLKNMDTFSILVYQKNRWAYPNCDGTIKFYPYQCDKCGTKSII
jgi:hypothetical protein